MGKFLKIIRWRRIQPMSCGDKRLAIAIISTGTTERPTDGEIDILKTDFKDAFGDKVRYEDIRLIRASVRSFGSERHWILIWETPHPGISAKYCEGWSVQGTWERVRDFDWIKEHPLQSIVEFLQWFRIKIL